MYNLTSNIIDLKCKDDLIYSKGLYVILDQPLQTVQTLLKQIYQMLCSTEVQIVNKHITANIQLKCS